MQAMGNCWRQFFSLRDMYFLLLEMTMWQGVYTQVEVVDISKYPKACVHTAAPAIKNPGQKWYLCWGLETLFQNNETGLIKRFLKQFKSHQRAMNSTSSFYQGRNWDSFAAGSEQELTPKAPFAHSCGSLTSFLTTWSSEWCMIISMHIFLGSSVRHREQKWGCLDQRKHFRVTEQTQPAPPYQSLF